ncbi:MAG TPA: histidine--tRNA ligase [Flavobacteriales bacterium]|nr:histidine--tRNA ligase [Flavobacteriales bacterium]HMR26442.1 histidine--tRNA ligase [Flavobacteriales bacterium]
MATKPSIPKGTRDFGPQEMLRRKYIFSTIERVFQKYGFLPLETPAMEHLETLTGKYGEEGDRLIFKVLKRGAELERALEDRSKGLADEALRYDLTVPFARYVVQHQNELSFPFKRYQIQPVWRADRPQKGRYREFVQCDADVIGSTSLLSEVDLIFLLSEVFETLSLPVTIYINNRKVLVGLAELFGVKDRMVEFITIMDKKDKIGVSGVLDEMRSASFSQAAIVRLKDFYERLIPLEDQKSSENHGMILSMFVEANIETGILGMNELSFVFNRANRHEAPGLWARWVHDMTLARGLDYYTGAIFEVKANEGTLRSSISGGGRYDDLTGVFGLKGMSGVGISFGADRIYDVLLETNKFPAELGGSTRLLFANFGEAEALHCLKLLRAVRDAGIAAELYPDKAKMAKQFKYADDKGIPYVAILGENELKQGLITVKDMKSGEQKAVRQEELVGLFGTTDATSK